MKESTQFRRSQADDPRAHVPLSQLTAEELLELVGPSWHEVMGTQAADWARVSHHEARAT